MANPEMSKDEVDLKFSEIIQHEFGNELSATDKEKLYMAEVDEEFVDFIDWLAETENANVKNVTIHTGTGKVNKKSIDADLHGVCYRRAGSDEIFVNNEQYLNLSSSPAATPSGVIREIHIAQLFDSRKDQEELNPYSELIISRNDRNEITFMQPGKKIDWKNILESTHDRYIERYHIQP